VAIGTPPLTVTSTTNVPNLNASSVSGNTVSAPTGQWGIGYASTATNYAATAALTANALIKAGNAAAPSASSVIDNGTTVAASENITTPGITVNALANPSGTPTGTPASTGGTVTASAYNYVQIVALDTAGNNTTKGTISAAVTTTSCGSGPYTCSIAWSWTSVSNAASYQVWVCQGSSCTPANYFTSNTNSYTQTAQASTGTGGTLPTANTTGNLALTYLNGAALTQTYYVGEFFGTTSTVFEGGTLNHIVGYGVEIKAPVTFSNVLLSINTTQASNTTYGAALATTSGTAVCHTTSGVQLTSNNTFTSFPCAEGAVTIQPGLYILLTTSNSATGTINTTASNTSATPYYNANVTGCTASSGVFTFTTACSISLSPVVSTMPVFMLH
jgi:hypothetical protein